MEKVGQNRDLLRIRLFSCRACVCYFLNRFDLSAVTCIHPFTPSEIHFGERLSTLSRNRAPCERRTSRAWNLIDCCNQLFRCGQKGIIQQFATITSTYVRGYSYSWVETGTLKTLPQRNTHTFDTLLLTGLFLLLTGLLGTLRQKWRTHGHLPVAHAAAADSPRIPRAPSAGPRAAPELIGPVGRLGKRFQALSTHTQLWENEVALHLPGMSSGQLNQIKDYRGFIQSKKTHIVVPRRTQQLRAQKR